MVETHMDTKRMGLFARLISGDRVCGGVVLVKAEHCAAVLALIGDRELLEGERFEFLGENLDGDRAASREKRPLIEGQQRLGPKPLVLRRCDVDDVKGFVDPGHKAKDVVVDHLGSVTGLGGTQILLDDLDRLGGLFDKDSFAGSSA